MLFRSAKSLKAAGDILTLTDLQLWYAGGRQIKGYDFDSLPEETRIKIQATMGKLGDKKTALAARKAASGEGLIDKIMGGYEAACEAAGIAVDPETAEQVRKFREAQAEKAKKAGEVVEPASTADATPVLQAA